MDANYIKEMNALDSMEFCELIKFVSTKTGGLLCDQT